MIVGHLRRISPNLTHDHEPTVPARTRRAQTSRQKGRDRSYTSATTIPGLSIEDLGLSTSVSSGSCLWRAADVATGSPLDQVCSRVE